MPIDSLPWYDDRSANLARNPRRRRRKDLSAVQLPSTAPWRRRTAESWKWARICLSSIGIASRRPRCTVGRPGRPRRNCRWRVSPPGCTPKGSTPSRSSTRGRISSETHWIPANQIGQSCRKGFYSDRLINVSGKDLNNRDVEVNDTDVQ